MTPLETFLKIDELDDLREAREHVSSITLDEEQHIEGVIRDWADAQAVANLLFHPDLIPARVRLEAIDRGLHCYDAPYFALAATIGLGRVNSETVPEGLRQNWIETLLAMVRSRLHTFAVTAVNVLSRWAPADALKLLALFPVPDSGASNNILAFALARFGELPRNEFIEKIADCGVHAVWLSAFGDLYDEYQHEKAEGRSGAGLKLPVFSYIPNLSEIDQSQQRKPRRKLWRVRQWWGSA
jgi:hypothetical protein